MVRVVGEIIGVRRREDGVAYTVVRVLSEGRPEGPAENAVILVRDDAEASAKYVSWIGHHDIEVANRFDGRWELVDPPEKVERHINWDPFCALFPDSPLPHSYF